MRRESIDIPVTRRRLLEIVQRIDLFNDVIADPQGFIEEMTQVLDEMVLEHVVSPLGTEFIISDNPAFPRQLTLDESSGPVDLIYLPLSPKKRPHILQKYHPTQARASFGSKRLQCSPACRFDKIFI